MQQFVKGRAGAAAEGQDGEMLQSREQFLAGLKVSHNGPNQKKAHPQGLARPKSNPHFRPEPDEYGANTGSIDQTSIAGSDGRLDHAESGQPRHQRQSRPARAEHHKAEGKDDVNGGDEASDEQAGPNNEASHAGGHPGSRNGIVTAHQHGHVSGNNFPQIPGDSYPPTTDGEPSISDHAENGPRHGAAHAPAPGESAAARGIPTRGAGNRLLRGRHNVAFHERNMQPEVAVHQNQSSPVAQRLFSAQPSGDPLGSLASGFTYDMARPAKMSMGLQQPTPTQAVTAAANAPQQRELAQGLQRESVVPPAHSAHPDGRHQVRDEAAGQPTPETQRYKPVKDTKRKRTSKPAHAVQASHAEPQKSSIRHQFLPRMETSYDYSDEYEQSPGQGNLGQDEDHGRPGRHPHAEGRPTELDFSQDFQGQDLYNKTFEDLRGAAFDEDPQAPAFQLPDVQRGENLSQFLDSMFDLKNEEYQEECIRSLTIEEWEDAGDWFLARFGDLAKRFKEGRQEKRKVARAFEDDIQRRHEAVMKKKKRTDAALAEMKESGGRVLQGTPTKM